MKFFKLAACCALFIAACMPAHSQTEIRANIPFDFTVGSKSLPSGEYVMLNGLTGNNASWVITNQKGEFVAFLMTNPVVSPTVEHSCSLLFRRFGGEYVLTQFWQGSHQGQDVIIPKRSRLMIAQTEVVQITAHQ